ncbi:rho-related GTP-binding protein RhoN isoform X1 [Nilaparvata lugens]|uniref:rho-related GTP-binding protein RhoN isoform X1 n=1 Tax=Nilaparvata lugens TaxID=108931 RepID=UPI00193C905B|nr:rho-related GTP-binding protein RhoN isoform X1 [Nilaparvata lugens]
MPASKNKKKCSATNVTIEANYTDVDCKVVVVGDSKCGKTCMIQRFASDKYNEVYTPTGFEKYAVTYNVGDYRAHFSIWDTSGAAAYDTVRPLAYQDVKVFLLCFRVSDPESLDNAIKKWYPEIRQHCESTPVILCGCQSDLRNDIETISILAKQHRIPVTSEQAVYASRQINATTYVETSSKTSVKGVRDAFEVALLAALGKLNKNHALQRHKAYHHNTSAQRSKSKLDLKSELKDRAKSCSLM